MTERICVQLGYRQLELILLIDSLVDFLSGFMLCWSQRCRGWRSTRPTLGLNFRFLHSFVFLLRVALNLQPFTRNIIIYASVWRDFIGSHTFHLIFASLWRWAIMVLNYLHCHTWTFFFFLPHYFKVSMIYEGQTQDVMIVINLNRCERKRPTADLYTAYGWGILFSLHQITLLSPESACLASLCKTALPDSSHPVITLYHACLFRHLLW